MSMTEFAESKKKIVITSGKNISFGGRKYQTGLKKDIFQHQDNEQKKAEKYNQGNTMFENIWFDWHKWLVYAEIGVINSGPN